MAKKILVIDDDPDVCAVLAIRLESFGYEMIPARSGQDAFERAKFLKPDLIFLDYQMPNQNGLDVLKKLKIKTPDLIHEIPVIMLTGREELEKECLEAGAAGYITKPFDLYQMKETLTKFLEPS